MTIVLQKVALNANRSFVTSGCILAMIEDQSVEKRLFKPCHPPFAKLFTGIAQC
jgi:hypothetical protein